MPDTVIVTGGSRGIGAAICADLVGRGYDVAALSRSGEASAGRGIKCDVSDENALRAVIGKVAAGHKVVGLVNNAGAHSDRASAELSADEFESVIRLNTTSALVSSREVYPHIKAAGGGLIVNIGSIYDKLGVPGSLAYCASKAALGAITRCLASEWAKDKIRVINVAPGYVATDLNRDFLSSDKIRAWLGRRVPVGRAGEATEIARFVGSLFADGNAYLTGETIYVDGGHGMNL